MIICQLECSIIGVSKNFIRVATTSCLQVPKDALINLACTYFYLGMYQESEKAAEKAEKAQLRTRLRFHLAHKFADEKKLMSFHQELEDVIEDQVAFLCSIRAF